MERRITRQIICRTAVIVCIAWTISLILPGQTFGADEAERYPTFEKTVQPFLAKHCYSCHSENGPEKDVPLNVFLNEASLDKGLPTLEKALEMLRAKRMPPRRQPQPTSEEVQPVLAWLEKNIMFECPPNEARNPGRVTIRRLNRTEYNNTIRDLVAINFRPADSFPVDDSGYGFDNNGDVLSMAPVLLDKYLTAAQLVLDKAILADPVLPPPSKQWVGATAEGTLPKSDPNAALDGGFFARNMYNGRVFQYAGEIYADHDFPTDGEYVFRIRAYGTARPQVQILVDDQPVNNPITVTGDQRGTLVYGLPKAKVAAGKRRVTARFINGATEEEYRRAAATQPATTQEATPPPDPEYLRTPARGRAGGAPAAVQPPVVETPRPPAAETAAEAVATDPAAAAAVAPATAPASQPVAEGRGARRGGGAGRGGRGTITGKPIVGIVYFEVEGPLEVTPDRMPESYQRVMIAHPSATVSKEQAAEKIVRNFATKAYRRPVQEDEVKRLMKLWAEIDAGGESFKHSIHAVLQVVLSSPHFLYRIEKDPDSSDPTGIRTLDEYELATRLSYFLWSSMPDSELFALAQKGQLRANLDAQIQRMLKDPKSFALVENFAGQWLQLRQMMNVTPDAKIFPTFDEPLRQAMMKETQLFFNAVMREDRSVLDFIDADFTFLNERLAKHYGREDITGDEFQRVTFTKDQRGGLLTQASVLTITSYPNRTSPVQRGKWVLENLLNAPPPPPPPNVPELKAQGEIKGTLRQRMEQHRENPACSSCHEQMDAIGFSLENFDAIGSWRNSDDGASIDATGHWPGGATFNGPAELKKILRSQQDAFSRCMAEKMLTFALGRGLEKYDRCTVDDIALAVKGKGYRFSEMVLQIVKSDPFQKRSSK